MILVLPETLVSESYAGKRPRAAGIVPLRQRTSHREQYIIP